MAAGFFNKLWNGIKKGAAAVKKVVWDKPIEIMNKVSNATLKPITSLVKTIAPSMAPLVDGLTAANNKIANFFTGGNKKNNQSSTQSNSQQSAQPNAQPAQPVAAPEPVYTQQAPQTLREKLFYS